MRPLPPSMSATCLWCCSLGTSPSSCLLYRGAVVACLALQRCRRRLRLSRNLSCSSRAAASFPVRLSVLCSPQPFTSSVLPISLFRDSQRLPCSGRAVAWTATALPRVSPQQGALQRRLSLRPLHAATASASVRAMEERLSEGSGGVGPGCSGPPPRGGQQQHQHKREHLHRSGEQRSSPRQAQQSGALVLLDLPSAAVVHVPPLPIHVRRVCAVRGSSSSVCAFPPSAVPSAAARCAGVERPHEGGVCTTAASPSASSSCCACPRT